MLSALREGYPEDFADHYALGMRVWGVPDQATMLDRWMVEHDDANNEILWKLAVENRGLIDSLIA
jgi:hypothetical protein